VTLGLVSGPKGRQMVWAANCTNSSVENLWMTFALCSPTLASMSRYDKPSHTVYMKFFFRRAWQVQFAEADLKTPLPRTLTFADPEKIRELARRGERGEAWGEARSMLEHTVVPSHLKKLDYSIGWRLRQAESTGTRITCVSSSTKSLGRHYEWKLLHRINALDQTMRLGSHD
jgi:hypothetical protein